MHSDWLKFAMSLATSNQSALFRHYSFVCELVPVLILGKYWQSKYALLGWELWSNGCGRSIGHEFEAQHQILLGISSHLIVVKLLYLKRLKVFCEDWKRPI